MALKHLDVRPTSFQSLIWRVSERKKCLQKNSNGFHLWAEGAAVIGFVGIEAFEFGGKPVVLCAWVGWQSAEVKVAWHPTLMFSCKVLIAKCFPAETQDITLAKKLPAPPARFYWQSDETRATGLFFFGSCSQLCPETRFLFQFLGALYSTAGRRYPFRWLFALPTVSFALVSLA